MPAVSVLMPAYNTKKYLRASVESVLNQTFTDFQFVIVDDGSTDGTSEILQEYSARDSRIHLIRKRNNEGLTNALTTAFGAAQGPYIARMDSDDIAMPTRLAQQVQHLESHCDCVVVGTRAITIDVDGRRGPPFYDGHMDHRAIDQWHMSGRGNCLVHPTVMFRRSAFDRVGGYRPKFEPAEDYELWLRFAEVGELAVLPEYLLEYRVHPQSVTKTRGKEQQRAYWQSLAEAIGRRNYDLRLLKFDELPEDLQYDWIELAHTLGEYAVARSWAMSRVFRNRSPVSVKQAARVALGGQSRHLVRIYDRLTGKTAEKV